MTWLDFMKYYDVAITKNIAEYILWNETAFPFSDLRMTTYQIRSAIRLARYNREKQLSTIQGGLMMDKCRHGNEKYKCNLCVIRGEVETIHGWREIAKESPTRTGIYIAYKYPDDYNGEMYSCELWSEKHGGWCEAETEFDLWLELPDPPMSTIQGG